MNKEKLRFAHDLHIIIRQSRSLIVGIGLCFIAWVYAFLEVGGSLWDDAYTIINMGRFAAIPCVLLWFVIYEVRKRKAQLFE